MFSFIGPLAESLTMVVITTNLILLTLAAGIPCYNKVFDFSFIFNFSLFMSHFTLSNQLTNFIKSGPIRMIPDEKYGGHLIVLLCNIATIFFKMSFVVFINMVMNDSIYVKQLIPNSLTTDFDFINTFNTTTRYVFILSICVLPSALIVSSLNSTIISYN